MTRKHIGCNVTTCPQPACRLSGECVNRTLFMASPPLAPTDASRTIIAFTGLAGAGKSTAAAHLVKLRGFERVRFAGPLKAMMAALGCTAAEIDGDRKETPCDLLGGKTPRWAMQTLGTEWGRQLIGPDLWIRAWRAAVDRLPAGTPVVVDDCRFPNEAEAIRSAGGVVVRLERPGAGTASTHESEQHHLDAIHVLHNTLDEQNLREQVDVFLRDLSWVDRSLPRITSPGA
ncbi:deoxynucleotide monophosphate kinase [Bradyrhizobium oligotrophicum S58]